MTIARQKIETGSTTSVQIADAGFVASVARKAISAERAEKDTFIILKYSIEPASIVAKVSANALGLLLQVRHVSFCGGLELAWVRSATREPRACLSPALRRSSVSFGLH